MLLSFVVCAHGVELYNDMNGGPLRKTDACNEQKAYLNDIQNSEGYVSLHTYYLPKLLYSKSLKHYVHIEPFFS